MVFRRDRFETCLYNEQMVFGDILVWQKVVIGGALEALKKMPSECVDLVMTSPPYYGMRDYHAKNQIGLEPSADEYLSNLRNVFLETKRVLKSTGSFYLNMGDTYQKKNLMMIPARLAIMLQNDGWILRNDIIWFKPNAMPSSVKDRLQNKYEHIFHFVKSCDYYYNLDAIREPHKYAPGDLTADSMKRLKRILQGKPTRKEFNAIKLGIPGIKYPACPPHRGYTWGKDYGKHTFPTKFHPNGKNPGDIFGLTDNEPSDFWRITLRPCSLPHFAVYPEALCIKPIKSSCPPNGVVLDPFTGSGTTLKAAHELGRNSIGIELNPKFIPVIKERLGWKNKRNTPLRIFSLSKMKRGILP